MHKEWAESAFFCPKSSPLLSKKKNISYMRIINRGYQVLRPQSIQY
ncbi:Uncharacterised protein [Shigella sonnei]|nr:Uncharacterised protein [Shigella sonnei]CSQ77417.1 Uncharacterised protein [Shigella sonnei]CSS16402.1 Uncharacterised protein [Shigella sonnei]CST21649.1 Uncharacterised protein [Shigella sonnei]